MENGPLNHHITHTGVENIHLETVTVLNLDTYILKNSWGKSSEHEEK